MSIVTSKGDQGKSSWLGRSVNKDDLLLEVIGSVDEVQSVLGLAKAEIEYGFLKNEIEKIQKDMWLIVGELAGYKVKKAGNYKFDLKKRIREMEVEIGAWERKLPMIRDFVLPGVNNKEAILHLCRSMARRLERKVVSLTRRDKVDTDLLPYLNRLSDYLFMLARQVAE